MTTSATTTETLPASLSLLSVSKTFERDGQPVPVLTNINLAIAPGEIVTILGPSGCGKSTLLRLIAGLETPTTGVVSIDDEVIDGINARASFVFQEPRLLPWRTVSGNVALGARGRRANDEIEHWLGLVGLTGFATFLPRQISGGMAQRTALARALISAPGVLLLDEPFAALDALTRMKMQDLLLDVAAELGTTVLLVTHDVDEALYLGDRVVVLADRGHGIADEFEVPVPRPRDRADDALTPLRRSLLQRFGIHV